MRAPPKKYARALLGMVEDAAERRWSRKEVLDNTEASALVWLRAQVAPKRRTEAQRATEARRDEKRLSKKEARQGVRDQVVGRADGKCECGCNVWFTEMDPGELDHFWGRGKAPETLESCWLLRRDCHRAKTENKPSAQWWLDKFREHCWRRVYVREFHKVEARLESLALAAESEAVGSALSGGRER